MTPLVERPGSGAVRWSANPPWIDVSAGPSLTASAVPGAPDGSSPGAPSPTRPTPAPVGGSRAGDSGAPGRSPADDSAGALLLHAMHLVLTGRSLWSFPLAIPTGVVFDVPVPPGWVAAS